MKIAAQCKSPLLQKSLELFLQKYLCSSNKCDIIVRDEECLNDEKCFYIGNDEKADLKKPFSKTQLILALEKRYRELNIDTNLEDEIELNADSMNFDILEQRIELLTQEYKENILRTVKAFYEK